MSDATISFIERAFPVLATVCLFSVIYSAVSLIVVLINKRRFKRRNKK